MLIIFFFNFRAIRLDIYYDINFVLRIIAEQLPSSKKGVYFHNSNSDACE